MSLPRSYIKTRFVNMNENIKREMFSFYTTATDTDLVKKVLDSVQEIVFTKILKNTGFC